MNINGSIALVTGASSGIGLATAERLAKAGYKVYGTSRRGAQEDHRSFHMLSLDVTNDESVEAAVSQLIRSFAPAVLVVDGVRKNLRLGRQYDADTRKLQQISEKTS